MNVNNNVAQAPPKAAARIFVECYGEPNIWVARLIDDASTTEYKGMRCADGIQRDLLEPPPKALICVLRAQKDQTLDVCVCFFAKTGEELPERVTLVIPDELEALMDLSRDEFEKALTPQAVKSFIADFKLLSKPVSEPHPRPEAGAPARQYPHGGLPIVLKVSNVRLPRPESLVISQRHNGGQLPAPHGDRLPV